MGLFFFFLPLSDKYGLGNYEGRRTLQDFEKLTGVSFSKATIEERALWGGLNKQLFVDGLLETVLSLAGLSHCQSAATDELDTST